MREAHRRFVPGARQVLRGGAARRPFDGRELRQKDALDSVGHELPDRCHFAARDLMPSTLLS